MRVEQKSLSTSDVMTVLDEYNINELEASISDDTLHLTNGKHLEMTLTLVDKPPFFTFAGSQVFVHVKEFNISTKQIKYSVDIDKVYNALLPSDMIKNGKKQSSSNK